MKVKRVISASQSRFAARVFTLASMVATLLPPLLMIWIAASIFVYASIAHHPNPRVVHFNRWAGYRFYGAAGFLMVFGQPIFSLLNDWHIALPVLWGLLALCVIPWGIWDLIRVSRENWQDLVIEVAINE